MSKLQEIRDALQKYAADEAECHVRGMTHIPKTACDALATLDALMETHVIVPIERIDGLKEAIIYFEHDGHDKETPYAITWDDKMSLMLKAARAHLKLQEENDE